MDETSEFGASPLGKSSRSAQYGDKYRDSALENMVLKESETDIEETKRVSGLFFAADSASHEEGDTDRALPDVTETQDKVDEEVLDIYGDLDQNDAKSDVDALREKLRQMTDRNVEQDKIIVDLEEKVKSLQREVESLTEEKETLTYNISALFNTAKLEIQRKDDAIKSLRQQVADADSNRNREREDDSRPRNPNEGRPSVDTHPRDRERRRRDTSRERNPQLYRRRSHDRNYRRNDSEKR